MSQQFTVLVPAAVWMSANGRYHWADRARRTRVLRAMAAAQCRRHHIHADGPVRVVAEISYRSGRADPANAYPTVKALIDGMTDAGVWPDDDSQHVIGPDMRRATDPSPKGFHTVTIRVEGQ
ncbi:hypothetical protein FYJ43_04480 [Cutibacterium sp. WCA-380-WT-3A]|uniref:Uncharacterized protein n=1 Tax=Cutibacterium porci TaxID=2605781 RepID=A0A7K0J5V2_9ACTN|nr:hypothetical protein [Cutibacterium porci]MSS45314.1 hypothetical protein [Cutibacterium porci]